MGGVCGVWGEGAASSCTRECKLIWWFAHWSEVKDEERRRAAGPKVEDAQVEVPQHSPICLATVYASSEELATIPVGTEIPASFSRPMLMYSCRERFLFCCWLTVEAAPRTWSRHETRAHRSAQIQQHSSW